MKIVIDIPEEEYKCVQITGCIGNKTCISNAIYNGTPLPKGHGRLIDESKITSCEWDVFLQTMITNAPAIIEADKEQEE